jgi:hypothetical protein
VGASWDSECSEAEEGVHEGHCFHDLPATSEHFPGSVCCWCGDIFLLDWDEVSEHGEYLPKVYHHKKIKDRIRKPAKKGR